jgi:8-oxo-dGTP diphosphatase
VHFTDYDTRLAASAAIVDDQDRILLTWFNGSRSSPSGWTMPGGGVEFDESFQDAVVREVMEEAGYVVEVGDPLAFHHFTQPGSEREGRPFKSVRVVFDARIAGGNLGTTEVDGTTDFAEWVPIAQVPTLAPRAGIIDVVLEALARRPISPDNPVA